MEMLNVVFTCALLGIIFPTGECYSISTIHQPKKEYLPGESVSIRCRASAVGQEVTVMVQLVKLGYYIPRYLEPTSSTTVGYTEVMATNDEIDSYVQQKAAGRYTATGSHTDTESDYTYTITDLKVEDYGNFTCGLVVDGETQPIGPIGHVSVRVLGPVLNMAIMHDESRTDWGNNPERDNPDNKITWVARDSREYLTCMVQYTTSPPTEWNVTLYDPSTNTSTDVKNMFRDYLPSTVAEDDKGFLSLVIDLYFLSEVPTSWENSGEVFGYKDSGKTLRCTCKVEGYDEVYEASTVLDVQFSPKETSCFPRSPDPEASVGTRNFKLLCYTRSVPKATITWKANNAALRDGITVENEDKGSYLVSVLTIDEVQESDFTSYSFEAANEHGTVTFPENGQTAWEIKKGSAVNQALDVEAGNYPWNPNTSEASVMSTSGTLIVLLAVPSVLYWITEN